MARLVTLRPRHGKTDANLTPPPGERIPNEQSALHDQIADRAYELYLARGSEDGHDLEDWFEAERMVSRQQPEPESGHEEPERPY